MKILFLAEAVSLAHVGRPLVLARWAVENGIEVHFAASANGLKKTNAEAFVKETHLLDTIDENLFYRRVNQGKFFYEIADLKKYVAQEQTLIWKIKPDLIVSDFRLTAAISAELTGKPLLNLSNSYWCPHYSCKFPAPEFGIYKLLPQRTSEFVFNFVRPFAFKFFGKELNQTREFFGLKKRNDFREFYTDGSFNAYMDLPQFTKINKLPENHFFLGPIIWSPETNSKINSLSEINNVYISMGSTGDNSLLPQIIEASFKNDLNIIISGINASEKEQLLKRIPELDGRSLIAPFIQAEQILPYCKLTICHGGSGTVYQSISKGVPVLCLPKNPDQGLVSMSVVHNNIGRYLVSKDSNTSSIEKMIRECISNEIIYQNTVNMQTAIQKWDTKKHWNQFISKFKTIRKIKKITA